jgi:hypothetical protein
MEMFPTGMSRPNTCVVSFHAKGDIPCVVIEDILQDAWPLCCVYHSIIPFGECCVVKFCVLLSLVWPAMAQTFSPGALCLVFPVIPFCWCEFVQTMVLFRLPTKGTMQSRVLAFSSTPKRRSLTRSVAETKK